jgi:hypothetical protein
MKTHELHRSQGKMVEDIHMRTILKEFISSADIEILCGLGYFMLEKSWTEEKLEQDLGSEAIEILLDEAESIDYIKLKEIYGILKGQKLIK